MSDKNKAAPKTGGRGERFATAMDEAAAALNASIDFDKRLLRDDVRGSQAHARMLAEVGLISQDDAKQIVAGLDQVAGEFERGERTMDPALEDVHMNVETRLIELVGDPGRRLHTARSRNDQVATDMRLYALSSAAAIVVGIDQARVALVRRAREHGSTLLPGYTHLQRAQAVTLGHHLLAYAEMLGRDRGRFLDAARRASECPLGSGALAATSLPIDRDRTSADLGFAAPTRNSLDAVSDRDFCAELAFACALLGVHLSRFGEELVLWSTTEFGFVRLGEGHCSGSSLMPQKRNPDIAELLRAKPGRLVGDLVALLTVSKATTSPIRRPGLARRSSAMSGLRFCGISELPEQWPSPKRTKANSVVDHRTSSSPKRDRCTASRAQAKASSAQKSRSETASRLLCVGPEKPSASLVLSRSMGSEVAASAPAPSGHCEARRAASRKRPRSRPSIST